jgi:hypothetical protein
MKRDDAATIVRDIALSTNRPERLVAQLYAEALAEFRQGARIADYVPLFAARRVRESLRIRQP